MYFAGRYCDSEYLKKKNIFQTFVFWLLKILQSSESPVYKIHLYNLSH